MTIYVKECSAMNLNTVIPWFKKTIDIKPFISLDAVKTTDIVVISNTDSVDFYSNNRSYYNIVVFEDFSKEIT